MDGPEEPRIKRGGEKVFCAFPGAFAFTNLAIAIAILLQVDMPPTKIRYIDVEEGETIFLRVKSMYPITIEFQKGTLVAFEVAGGVFTRFALEKPTIIDKVEQTETQIEEDLIETQLMDTQIE